MHGSILRDSPPDWWKRASYLPGTGFDAGGREAVGGDEDEVVESQMRFEDERLEEGHGHCRRTHHHDPRRLNSVGRNPIVPSLSNATSILTITTKVLQPATVHYHHPIVTAFCQYRYAATITCRPHHYPGNVTFYRLAAAIVFITTTTPAI